jgi:hypothetical protein
MRRLVPAALLLVFVVASSQAAPGDEDTPKAAKARQLLKTKVSFDWKDTSFGDIIGDIKDQVKGVAIIPDTKGGVNLNKQMTYKCTDIPFEEALEGLIAKNGWGFYVKSQKGDAYDGAIIIRQSKERGYFGVDGKPGAKDK